MPVAMSSAALRTSDLMLRRRTRAQPAEHARLQLVLRGFAQFGRWHLAGRLAAKL